MVEDNVVKTNKREAGKGQKGREHGKEDERGTAVL
jgi:hypothetical protein